VPDAAAARAGAAALRGARPADLPRLPGLFAAIGYGSRGLIWSGIAAELIACVLEGEPLPLESDLVDALDPGRFVQKRLRQGTLQPAAATRTSPAGRRPPTAARTSRRPR